MTKKQKTEDNIIIEEYRKEISEILEKIENMETLEYLNTFIKLFVKKWG